MRRLLACGVLLAGALVHAGVPAQGLDDAAPAHEAPLRLLANELAAAIEGAVLARGGEPAISPAQRQELDQLYRPGGYRTLWLDAAHRPNRAAADALALLADAAAEGLDPADYHARQMVDRAAALAAQETPADRSVVAGFEVGMSLRMLRYLRHVHVGRVDPRALHFGIPSRAAEHDFAALLHSALADGRLLQTAAAMAPAFGQYRALRTALAGYRSLAADTALPPLPALSRTVRPGEPEQAASDLQRRLVALGDLPPDAALPSDVPPVYDGALVEGIERFQRRHGLAADGVLGKSTRAALQVPLSSRVRQIELAMERLRWLPHLGEQPFVAINIPMFRLWAFEPAALRAGPPLDMAVIVGRALDTQTPVFLEEMTHLVFRPYWNVPRSILRNEILPALQRDPGYLQRHDMEIVHGPGDDAQPVAPSAQNIALLRQGTLRLRQRPGPRNSLGLVKFVFPNDANVYMHGTPAQLLFSRSRRDFSHGCVRLEDPVALAEWALKDQPQWTRERILAAMQGTKTIRANLRQPVQVVLFYVTSAVMPADGKIHFAEDIYGHDRTLDAALARERSR